MAQYKKQPTLSEVARYADVSPASVSRVINNNGLVAKEMRVKIENAMADLGFVPHPPRSRLTGVDLLPLLVLDMINPYYTEIFQGAQDEAAEHDLFPIMINTTTDEKYEQNILNKLKNLKLNGLISLGTNLQPEQWIEFQEETGMPIVILDSLVKHPRIITISLKNEVASGRAIQHLLDLNHTRIAYLGIAGDESSAARLRGIETMLARRRLAMPSGFAVEFKNDNLGILQGIGRLVTLPLNERPTAMIVYNDYLAISAMHAIRVHGLRIPEDISIIGFDNIPMATHTNPPLTTVDMPKYQMGQMVVKLLQQLKKNGTNTGGQIYMDNTLIVRESTGPAPVY